MKPMSKNVLEVYRGDTAHIEIYITDLQPEGHYHYIPEAEDEIKLTIYRERTMLAEFTADVTNTSNAYFHIDTKDICPGEYLYDVTIKIAEDDEIYHIVKAEKIIIRR